MTHISLAVSLILLPIIFGCNNLSASEQSTRISGSQVHSNTAIESPQPESHTSLTENIISSDCTSAAQDSISVFSTREAYSSVQSVYANSPQLDETAPQPIALPTPVPAYTTEENILSNTLVATYRGERLISIHALDVKNHLTSRYWLSTEIAMLDERYVAALLESCDATPKAADRAFILFTDKGRHYIYLDKNTPTELITIWERIYSEDSPKNIHWLTHMTTSKIARINMGGLLVEDTQTISEIAEFLKIHLTVNTDYSTEIFDGADNPVTVAGHYHLRITFDNDVQYSLIGYGDYDGIDAGGSLISIYTSDLDKTISYMLNERVARRLRDFIEAR